MTENHSTVLQLFQILQKTKVCELHFQISIKFLGKHLPAESCSQWWILMKYGTLVFFFVQQNFAVAFNILSWCKTILQAAVGLNTSTSQHLPMSAQLFLSCSVQSRPLRRYGVYWVNIRQTWAPWGAKVGSLLDGITISIIGLKQ